MELDAGEWRDTLASTEVLSISQQVLCSIPKASVARWIVYFILHTAAKTVIKVAKPRLRRKYPFDEH